jgi:alpha-beta hydrolase superfamily lysophospholipase
MQRLLILAGLLVLGCSSAPPDPDPKIRVRTGLQAELEDFLRLDWNRKPSTFPASENGPFIPSAGPAATQYRSRLAEAGTWEGPTWHQTGTIPVTHGARTLALGINVFQPAVSRGTLLFLHGYMAHAADFAFTLGWFASHGWTVVTLDLPGHGMSEGPRSDIDDFAEYGIAVADWLRWVNRQKWPGPQVLLAHSMGSAAALEAFRSPDTPIPDQIIFCSPLLRTSWYPALWIADVTVGWMFESTSAKGGWDGYLDGYAQKVHWFHELGVWLERLNSQSPLDLPLTIYCGERDSVIDVGWNRWMYHRLVPQAKWISLPGLDHWILTGAEDRQSFHERLSRDLDKLLTSKL